MDNFAPMDYNAAKQAAGGALAEPLKGGEAYVIV